MFLSKVLYKGKVNLNSKWWNLRIYDIGYRSEPISSTKRYIKILSYFFKINFL